MTHSRPLALPARVAVLTGLLAVSALAHGWIPPDPPAPPPPAVNRRPAPGLSSRFGSQPGPAGVRAATPTLRRTKGNASPWLTRIHVPWQAAFLPVEPNANYSPTPLGIEAALERTPQAGGWMRKERPNLVLTYDASRPEHMKILNSMDADPRIRAAAHVFNCFRVDARSKGRAARGIHVAVFTRGGKRVGSLVTERGLSSVYKLMEQGFKTSTGSELSKVLPRLQKALGEIAHAEFELKRLQPELISSREGRTRDHVARMMSDWKGLEVHWKKELRKLQGENAD